MKTSRRSFLGSALGAALMFPRVHTHKKTAPSGVDDVFTGEGEYRFKVNHDFVKLPAKYKWQTSHNIAVDSENNLYVIHEGRRELKDHPAIFVFANDGKFIRAFGSQFQGGGHGIEIRKEGSDEFLYVAAYQQVKAFAKLTLKGETVWYKKAPEESGIYAPGEGNSTEASWTRQSFLPTNFAFTDDNGFLLADGYGSYFIHQFDKNANWVKCFGGPGNGDGKFQLSHGLWIDRRIPERPVVAVTDRSANRIQILSMDGEHLATHDNFGLPANFDVWEDLMVVPELKARVTLLNESYEVVAQLGAAVNRLEQTKNLRGRPKDWLAGQFVHPHDACFEHNGDIFVAEWVATGRITKLTRT